MLTTRMFTCPVWVCLLHLFEKHITILQENTAGERERACVFGKVEYSERN